MVIAQADDCLDRVDYSVKDDCRCTSKIRCPDNCLEVAIKMQARAASDCAVGGKVIILEAYTRSDHALFRADTTPPLCMDNGHIGKMGPFPCSELDHFGVVLN